LAEQAASSGVVVRAQVRGGDSASLRGMKGWQVARESSRPARNLCWKVAEMAWSQTAIGGEARTGLDIKVEKSWEVGSEEEVSRAEECADCDQAMERERIRSEWQGTNTPCPPRVTGRMEVQSRARKALQVDWTEKMAMCAHSG